MKTVFDKATREELIGRIGMLSEQSMRQWGKMTVYQMLRHCSLWDEMVAGEKVYKQVFIGKLFGKIALKRVTKDELPIGRNTPTMPEFVINGTGDVVAEKARWADLIGQYANFTKTNFMHPFFGKMTREQIGIMAYKHADHHLRQFNS